MTPRHPERGSPGGWGGRLAVALALAVVALALLLPVGGMLLRSFQLREVVTTDGRVIPAVGEVENDGRFVAFQYQPRGQQEMVPRRVPVDRVVEVRTVASLEHYAHVFGEARTGGLVGNSIRVALGAALVAMLLGLPVAFLVGRTTLPGRTLLAALCLGPVVLPTLLVAMGAGVPVGKALHAATGWTGQTLQLVTAMILLGFVLFPLVMALVARALAAVPRGSVEAARILGGRSAAWRRVVWPAVRPAVAGAFVLSFVLALSDFTVVNVLSFTLPTITTAAHVFPTEILLQWKHLGNTGRAVATGAPLLLVTFALIALSLRWLARSPVTARIDRPRPRVPLGWRGRLLGWVFVLAVLALSVGLPLAGIAGWALGHGTSVAASPNQPAPAPRGQGLFDFRGALAATPGWQGDLSRWLRAGLGAALVTMLVSVILVRWALRGGRLRRAVVWFLAVLPLAVPGLVFTVGTRMVWQGLDQTWADRSVLPSVLVLTGRYLPFGLAAAWLVLRERRPAQEQAAALLGAGPGARAWRVWGPPSGAGLAVGALVVLVLALREIDAVILVDPRILPLRLFDKIHFSRLADEANLAFLLVGVLLVPALLAVAVRALARRRLHRYASRASPGGP